MNKNISILPQFSRTLDMLGPEGFENLSKSFAIVVGLGGVGSHVTAALARAGIGKLRLIDSDNVTPSSLNRHAVAVLDDINQPKVEVMQKALKKIRPSMEIEIMQEFFHTHTADLLLDGSPDLVIDAIDSLNPKVALLKSCVDRGIKVISSMGASARTDPSKVRIASLFETQICPLAKHVRKRLRRQGITSGITVVYSIEKGHDPLPPDETESPSHSEGRIRNRLPSLTTLPGIFGYSLAGIAIEELSSTYVS